MSTFEEEELWRAAKALSNDTATTAVLSRLQDMYVDKWRSSQPHETILRDDAYHMVRAVAAFRQELSALAAEPDIARFNKRLKRA